MITDNILHKYMRHLRRIDTGAISLVKRGLATGRDNFPYRPTYTITPAGISAVEEMECTA